MGMPFPAAAAAIETQKTETALTYAELIAEIESSLPGHETAANVLNLTTRMQKDGCDFYTLLKSHSSEKLHHLLQDTPNLVAACKGNDAMYFHPDETYSKIECTTNESSCHNAWIKTLLRVSQFAAGRAFGPHDRHP